MPLFALVLTFAAITVALPLGALVVQSFSVDTYGLAFALAGAWVSKEVFDFVRAVIDHVGRPDGNGSCLVL